MTLSFSELQVIYGGMGVRMGILGEVIVKKLGDSIVVKSIQTPIFLLSWLILIFFDNF